MNTLLSAIFKFCTTNQLFNQKMANIVGHHGLHRPVLPQLKRPPTVAGYAAFNPSMPKEELLFG